MGSDYNGYSVAFGGDENVLESEWWLYLQISLYQPYEYPDTTKLYTLKEFYALRIVPQPINKLTENLYIYIYITGSKCGLTDKITPGREEFVLRGLDPLSLSL